MDHREREILFWNNYLAILAEHQIKSSLYTWYVRHCETFIKKNKDIRLKQHTKDSVSEYLSKLVNSEKQTAWQKKQAIGALRLLFKSIHAPFYQEIDWDYWLSSCKDLDRDHDTHYRTTHPVSRPLIATSAVLDSAQQGSVLTEVDRLRIAIRRVNYSIRTEKTYTDWVEKFLKFSLKVDDSDINQLAVMSFLEYLAIDRQVAPKTQSIALNAISFYFKKVLDREIGDISQFVRAKPREKLPVVLTRDEVTLALNELNGLHGLVVSLLYGAGLRIMEALRLRVQDIDFGYSQIIVRDGKGNKERTVQSVRNGSYGSKYSIHILTGKSG